MRKHTNDATTPVPAAATSGHAAALRPRRIVAALLAAIAVLLGAFATAAVNDGPDGVIGGGTQLSAGATADQPQDDADRDVAVVQGAFELGARILGATWS